MHDVFFFCCCFFGGDCQTSSSFLGLIIWYDEFVVTEGVTQQLCSGSVRGDVVHTGYFLLCFSAGMCVVISVHDRTRILE